MKTYKIQYTFTGEVEIDAENEEEARQVAIYKAYESCACNNDFSINTLEEVEDPEEEEHDWHEAVKHFYTIKGYYDELPPVSGSFALAFVFKPLEIRFLSGERTAKLHQEMMEVE